MLNCILAICIGSTPVIITTSILIKASASKMLDDLKLFIDKGCKGGEEARVDNACVKAMGEVALGLVKLLGSGLPGEVGDVGSLSRKLPDIESILE